MRLRDIKTVQEMYDWIEQYGSLPADQMGTTLLACLARLGGSGSPDDGVVEIHLSLLVEGKENAEWGYAYWKTGPTADDSVEVYGDMRPPLEMAYAEYAAAISAYEKKTGYSAGSFRELQGDERAPSWYGPPNKEHYAWRAKRFGEDPERGTRHLEAGLGTWGETLSPKEMQGWMDPSRTNLVLKDGSEVGVNDEYIMIYDDGRVDALEGDYETKGVLREDCLAWCLEHLTWIDRFGWPKKLRRTSRDAPLSGVEGLR